MFFEGIRQSFFHSWMSDIDRARQILFAVRRLTIYLEIYLADSKKCVWTHNMITRVSVEKLVIVPLAPSWMALRDICRKEAGRREITWGWDILYIWSQAVDIKNRVSLSIWSDYEQSTNRQQIVLNLRLKLEPE